MDTVSTPSSTPPKPPAKPASEEVKAREVAFMALQVGAAVSITSVAFVLGGRYLDGRFGTAPLFILIGIFGGLIASLYLVWQIVRPLQQRYRNS